MVDAPVVVRSPRIVYTHQVFSSSSLDLGPFGSCGKRPATWPSFLILPLKGPAQFFSPQTKEGVSLYLWTGKGNIHFIVVFHIYIFLIFLDYVRRRENEKA